MNPTKLWTISNNPPKNTDVFVVLSYAVKNINTLTKPTKAAVDQAYKWWKKFPQAKIIMSTGNMLGLGKADSTIMAEYAVKLGVPKKNLIEEDKSRNTY